MTTTRRKQGRPPKPGLSSRFCITLEPERVRQLKELQQRISGGTSAVIGTCIALQHAELKKEWPDDFS